MGTLGMEKGTLGTCRDSRDQGEDVGDAEDQWG